MEKEKILEMSRKENKNRDIVSRDAENKAAYITVEATSLFIGILFFVQIAADKGMNLSLIATAVFLFTVLNWATYAFSKIKKHMHFALLGTLFTILVTIDTIVQLFK